MGYTRLSERLRFCLLQNLGGGAALAATAGDVIAAAAEWRSEAWSNGMSMIQFGQMATMVACVRRAG
jgi:hypothetical protein